MNGNKVPLCHPIAPVELAPGVTMSFEVVPPVAVQQKGRAAGEPLSFLMGSRGYDSDQEPRHRVIIPTPFYLATFPVTQGQFAVWTGSADYAAWFAEHRDEVDEDTVHRNSFEGDPDLPAENMSWYEARTFLRWWNESGQLPAGLEARLPCEAEWEYACRAGTETEYWSGDGEAALREVDWYDGNSEERTHVVGEKNAPNPWGLHDLHGNVWEWCEDVSDAKAHSKRADGWLARAWEKTHAGDDVEFWENEDPNRAHPNRVMRGGSWGYSVWWCRSAFRFRGRPRFRSGLQGFRVLLALPGPAGLGPAEPCSESGGAGAERAGGRDDRPGERSAGAGAGAERNALDELRKPKQHPA